MPPEEDMLCITIGDTQQVAPVTVTETPTDLVAVSDSVDVHTFGDTMITAFPSEVVRVGEAVDPHLFNDSGGGDFTTAPPGHPTARQFLGLDAMPSGWPARRQYVVSNFHSSPTYVPIVRARNGPDDETVDGRGVTAYWHANNQAAVQINYIKQTATDSSSTARPALIGSYAKNSSDFTPKANVFRVWGNPSGLSSNLSPTGHISPVPYPPANGIGSYPGSWQEFKSLGAYVDYHPPKGSLTIDGTGDPWDGPGRSNIDCRPGALTDIKNWPFVDGVWFRNSMDGMSTTGSPLEVRNCLQQLTHDDGHFLGNSRVPPPAYLYKNMYWPVFMGISYLQDNPANLPPATGGEFTTIEGCVFAHNREFPFHYSSEPAEPTFYDGHAHANHMKWRGATMRPKLKYIDTTILMLGVPRENGLSQLCVPLGSTASNSHFIYYDMGHAPGDKPPTYADGSTGTGGWWQAGSMSLWRVPGLTVHVVSGTDLNNGVCTVHGDHPIRDFLWPACQKWIDEHPQYGIADMTTDWATNNTRLLAT